VLDAVDIVPPGSGIHQLNVESTVHAVCCVDNEWLCPDSVLGTDSHTAVNNGLGVFSIGELCACHIITPRALVATFLT